MTPYGGILPVITLLGKLGFQPLVEEKLSCDRKTSAMPVYQFVLAIVICIYIGFQRFNQFRFVARDPRQIVPAGGSYRSVIAVALT